MISLHAPRAPEGPGGRSATVPVPAAAPARCPVHDLRPVILGPADRRRPARCLVRSRHRRSTPARRPRRRILEHGAGCDTTLRPPLPRGPVVLALAALRPDTGLPTAPSRRRPARPTGVVPASLGPCGSR